MKRGLAVFLQLAIVLIGIGALALMLWEPHLEGRNAHATLFEIYFNDPFLAYAYTASIPFFVALYQAFRLFGYMGQNQTSSSGSMGALRNIQYSGLAVAGFAVGAVAYLVLAVRGEDDIAGGVAVGTFIMLCSLAVAAGAAVFQKLLQKRS